MMEFLPGDMVWVARETAQEKEDATGLLTDVRRSKRICTVLEGLTNGRISVRIPWADVVVWLPHGSLEYVGPANPWWVRRGRLVQVVKDHRAFGSSIVPIGGFGLISEVLREGVRIIPLSTGGGCTIYYPFGSLGPAKAVPWSQEPIGSCASLEREGRRLRRRKKA